MPDDGPAQLKNDALANMVTTFDGWINAVTGLGMIGRDKRRHAQIEVPREIGKAEIDALYRTDPIAARVVDVPARDMLRAWFQINIATADEDANRITSEDASRWAAGVQDKLDDLKARREFGRALRWAAMYGGAVIMIGVDDGGSREKPINTAALRDIKWLRALTAHQVTPGPKVTDFDSPLFGESEYYTISALANDLGGEAPKVHASRVLRFDGVELPDGARQGTELEGWGDSVYLRVRDALRDFHSGYESASVLLEDFAQTVWGLPELHRMISEGNEELIHKRAAVADFVRSVVNAVMIDPSIGETFERKSTPVAGLPDLLDRNGIKLAASSGQPLTLLLGLAPKGFATEDKSGQENWDDIISARQEIELRPLLDHLIGLCFAIQNGPSDGRVPDTWSIEFNPLTQPTEPERAVVRKTMAEADALYLDRDVLSSDEVANSRFGSDGFSIETRLDIAAREEFAAAEAVEQREKLASAEAEVERLKAEQEAAAAQGGAIAPQSVPVAEPPQPAEETSPPAGQEGAPE